MTGLVVVGAQWGDEGKGKLVDYLTSGADWVVRFQGGNNAGHTLVVGEKVFKLHLVPSGILHGHSVCAIAAGVVLDPQVFISELAGLQAAGIAISTQQLLVDRDTNLILAYHRILDQAREQSLGSKKIGTTGRGIGPAYEARAARTAVRIAELNYLSELRPKIEKACEYANLELQYVLKSDLRVAFSEVWQQVELAAEQLLPYMANVSLLVHQAILAGSKVVFEGAQGTLLDQTHGTVPFVTSAPTLAGAVTTGVGIGAKALEHVLGVAKAYTTRVGSGPFPTEMTGQLCDYLVDRGGEFGTTTGRRRRCGWFDIVAMRRAVRLNGFDSLAITKLDVLSGLPKIKLCIKYELDGKELNDLPSLASEQDRLTPIYVDYDGWTADLSKVRKWHDLPAEARLYLDAISEAVGCPISIVSVGPERNATIFLKSASLLKNYIAVD